MGSTVLKYLGSSQNPGNNNPWAAGFTWPFTSGKRVLDMRNIFSGRRGSNPKSYVQNMAEKAEPNQVINYNIGEIADPAAKEIVGVIYLEIQKILYSKIQPAQKGVKLYQLIKNLLKTVSLQRILPGNQALTNSLRVFLPNSLFEAISLHQINPKTSDMVAKALIEILSNLPKYLEARNLSDLKNQVTQFQSLNLAQANNQTNFVPGVLATGICKIIAFSVSGARARASLISSDEKVVLFLESLMISCSGELNQINPQIENSFMYYNCSELVQATFKKYPNLNPKINSIMFENIAQNIFLQILAPALKVHVSPQEMSLIQQRYGQVLLYFKAKMPNQAKALPEPTMLDNLRKMLPA